MRRTGWIPKTGRLQPQLRLAPRPVQSQQRDSLTGSDPVLTVPLRPMAAPLMIAEPRAAGHRFVPPFVQE